jgi:hypothetical protein
MPTVQRGPAARRTWQLSPCAMAPCSRQQTMSHPACETGIASVATIAARRSATARLRRIGESIGVVPRSELIIHPALLVGEDDVAAFHTCGQGRAGDGRAGQPPSGGASGGLPSQGRARSGAAARSGGVKPPFGAGAAVARAVTAAASAVVAVPGAVAAVASAVIATARAVVAVASAVAATARAVTAVAGAFVAVLGAVVAVAEQPPRFLADALKTLK